MPKESLVEVEGKVTDALGGGQYAIEPAGGGTPIRATLCGKMRQMHIQVMPGDKVRVGVSPYDLTHGLIQWRYKT
jgi:translation initiation factor IF-1